MTHGFEARGTEAKAASNEFDSEPPESESKVVECFILSLPSSILLLLVHSPWFHSVTP